MLTAFINYFTVGLRIKILMTGVKCKGYKNCDFRPISGFISEMIQDTAIVTIKGE